MPLKPVAQLDFSGGANPVVNPYLISQKQASIIQNLLLDEHGSLRTRDGSRVLTTSPLTTTPIRHIGLLSRINGQAFPFAVQKVAGSGGSPIAADVVTTGTWSSAGSKTISMTLGGTATVLIASVHFQDSSQEVTGITFDGTALEKIGHSVFSGNSRTELWGLRSPTTGSAKDLIATFSGTSNGGLLAGRSFTVATGWGTPVSDTGSDSAPTLDVTSATNDMVIDALTADNDAQAGTPGAGQTEQYDVDAIQDRALGSLESGAATVTMSWTLGSSQPWTHIAVNLLSVAAGSTIYKTDTDPWTSIGSLNEEPLPTSIGMSDKVVFLHGYATPKHWDGTTLASITADVGQTVPPGGKHGAFHLGALWLWNTSATTTSLDGPSSLRASAVNNMNDWPNANQIFVSKDDGQVGMGLSPFTIVETGISPTATLVLFKNYSGYQVTGVFGASTFSVQPIKSDMGCVAPRTIQFVSGFGIIRLTHKGFALYNGVEDRLISEEMRPLIFGDPTRAQDETLFAGLDFTNIDLSYASQSQNPPLYVAACPVSGTDLTRVFIYDLIRRGWTVCTFPTAFSCLNLIFSATQFPIIHAGTSTAGKIMALFDDDTTDEGVPIEWSVKTRSFFAGNPLTPAYWRRGQFLFNVEPNTTIDITPIIDGGERPTQTFSVTNPSGSDPLTVDFVASPDIMETAHTLQFTVAGVSHAHFRGFELHVSQKPTTKYVSRT